MGSRSLGFPLPPGSLSVTPSMSSSSDNVNGGLPSLQLVFLSLSQPHKAFLYSRDNIREFALIRQDLHIKSGHRGTCYNPNAGRLRRDVYTKNKGRPLLNRANKMK